MRLREVNQSIFETIMILPKPAGECLLNHDSFITIKKQKINR